MRTTPDANLGNGQLGAVPEQWGLVSAQHHWCAWPRHAQRIHVSHPTLDSVPALRCVLARRLSFPGAPAATKRHAVAAAASARSPRRQRASLTTAQSHAPQGNSARAAQLRSSPQWSKLICDWHRRMRVLLSPRTQVDSLTLPEPLPMGRVASPKS